jgi:uncharacterized peroxidase-related enzyme
MSRLDPLERSALPPDVDEHLCERYDETIGFTPRSLETMARRPEILFALGDLITAIWRQGTVPVGLKPLVALIASTAAGCRYCQAHEAVDALAHGVEPERVADVWSFESSPRFDAAERAALRLARDAAQVPNAVTDAHFAELREHWDEGQIVELLAVVALFGFLNRWNDSVATELEDTPLRLAGELLGPQGWERGKHG